MSRSRARWPCSGPKIYLTWKHYFANFALNQILGCSFALNLGVGWRRLDTKSERGIDFNAIDGLAKLVFRHKSGIRAYVSSLLVYQKQDDRESHLFALANAGISYEFPNKRGEIFFNVHTIFNRHFTYRLEPIRLEPFFAARQITLRLSRYF